MPRRVTADSAGNVYFSASNSVFRLASNGTLTLVAGNSRAGFSGDGGPAVNAQLNTPQGLALDAAGNLYIADSQNNRVRIVTRDGIINTFAGNGQTSFGGGPGSFNDGGPATNALLHLPMGVAVDKSGNVYIADTGDNIIRKVTTDGIINTFAGDSYPGLLRQDDGTAVDSEFNKPSDVAVDSSGNIYVADTTNAVDPQDRARIGTSAPSRATGAAGFHGRQRGDAKSATIIAPMALAFDSAPATSTSRRTATAASARWIPRASSRPSPAPGSPASRRRQRPDQSTVQLPDRRRRRRLRQSLRRRLAEPAHPQNRVEQRQHRRRERRPRATRAITARRSSPVERAAGRRGGRRRQRLYRRYGEQRVRKVATNGTITNVAGNGSAGSGDSSAATSAQLNSPQAVAVDAAGNVYIADTAERPRRAKSPAARHGVSTLGAAATSSTPRPASPSDAAGNVYVADLSRNVVRKIGAGGAITTVAGTGNAGLPGDGGPAASAHAESAARRRGRCRRQRLHRRHRQQPHPQGHPQRQRSPPFAGNGLPGFSRRRRPRAQRADRQPGQPRRRRVRQRLLQRRHARPQSVSPPGFIATIAGNGTPGYSGDGGAAPQRPS